MCYSLIFTCCARVQCSYFCPIVHKIMLLRNFCLTLYQVVASLLYYRIFHKDCLKSAYYASISIMLNAFRGLLCSKLCWHNGLGPIDSYTHTNSQLHSCIPLKIVLYTYFCHPVTKF